MPFTTNLISSLDLNNKEITCVHMIDSNSAMVGTVGGGGLFYVSDIAGSVLTQATGMSSNGFVGVCVSDGYVFSLGNTGHLESRSLADLATGISNITIPGDPYGLACRNSKIYAVNADTLRIYSHSNGVLTLENTLTIASTVFNKTFKLIGNFLYFLNGAEFRIYSVTADPLNPVLKAEVTSPDGDSFFDCDVTGNYLFMNRFGDNIVHIRDITPIINNSGSFPLSNSGIPIVSGVLVNNCRNIAINSTTLFVSEVNSSPEGYNIRSFDITNPLSVSDSGTAFIGINRDHPVGGPHTQVLRSLSNRIFIGVDDFTFGPKRFKTFSFSLTPTAPFIIDPPEALSVGSGNSASFSVNAMGTPVLTYQWKKNGVNISGATSSTYNIPVVNTSHAGNYTVTITNGVGNITSTPVALTVLTTPVINSDPESASANAGDSVYFSVEASGGIPLSYQWKKNGVNIVGATANTLQLPSVIPTDAGSYTAVVANSFGSVVSNPGVLTVNPVPGNLLTVSNSFPNNGNNFRTVVIGTKAFMMGDTTGLTLLDVSNPASPVVLDNKFYAGGGPTWTMVAAGNYLYLTWGTNLISVFIGDIISNVSSTLPALVTGSVSGQFKWLATDGTSIYGGTENGNPKSIVKWTPVNGLFSVGPDWTLSLGTDQTRAGAIYGNFLIEISTGDLRCINKTTGQVISTLSLPGQFGLTEDVEVYQNAIYVTKQPDLGFGIRVYDLSNIGIIGSLITSGTFGSGMSNSVYTLTRKDNFLYASDNSGKMFVFDITNSHSPIFFASSSPVAERFRKPAIDNSQRVFATTFSNPSRFVVLAFDTAPVITSTAPNQGEAGVQYTYNPTVLDNESNVTGWSLINAPGGMSINPGNGHITWTPGSGVLTSGTFYLKVTDSSGLIDVEQITIYVSQGIQFTPGTPVDSSPTPSGNILHIPGNAYNTPATFQFTELELDSHEVPNIKFLDYGFKITTTGSTTFNHPLTLIIHYTDAQLAAAGVTKEDKLKVLFFDTNTNKWVNLHTTVDKANNIATAELPHLTEFGFGEGENGAAAKVDTTLPGFDGPVTVLTYLRDTDTSSMRAFYIFVDQDGNLNIGKVEGHEAGSPGDLIGEDSSIE